MKTSRAKFAVLAIATSAIIMLAPSIVGNGQIGPSRPAPAPATVVRGEGCVREGVEAGCLMVIDRETDTLYNLYFSSKDKPSVGDGIYFTGTLRAGATACMQGKPVDVKTWMLRKSIKCTAPDKKRNPY